MKGFSFHAAMPAERKSKSASKRYPFQPWTRATMKAMATSVFEEWLRARTVRIDESTARLLHPALFEYLDSAD